jgi:low temperature requirement protein LtrA
MPLGGFLDSLPSLLFVSAHVLFLLVGLWAANAAARAGRPYASLLWLYALSQLFFLAFFGGAITMKMAVLVEQTLMVILIAGIAMKSKTA